MITVTGQAGISAKIIKHSVSNGTPIFTLELEYPRFIHSEVMTHRMLSKNSASSRAIPVKKMLEMIRNDPAMPVYWGKNQPGMQAAEELSEFDKLRAKDAWKYAAMWAAIYSERLVDLDVHKQISNRICEPFQRMKTVVTGTEWNNFFKLRDHPAAQPEFRELAQCMLQAMKQSRPDMLLPGEWHLPYVNIVRTPTELQYWVGNEQLRLETALMVSTSCCAQVSYRNLDDSIEKAKAIFDRLNLRGENGEPAHSSPAEHQATPMKFDDIRNNHVWDTGVTHTDRYGDMWSGNFKSWIQHRQIL